MRYANLRLLVVINFVLAIPIVMAGKLYAEEPGRYAVEKIPQQIINYHKASLGFTSDGNVKIGHLNELISDLSNLNDDPDLNKKKLFWAGSKIQADTSMNVNLVWNNKNRDVITTFLDFQGDSVIFRMSHPLNQAYRGGYRIRSSQPGQLSTIFLEGDSGKGFVTLLAPRESAQSWSIGLCPRHFEAEINEYEVSKVIDTGFRVTSGSYEATGSSSGSFTTVGRSAFARSAILTSLELPLGKPFEDVARSADPAVSISYRPASLSASSPASNEISADVISKGSVAGIQAVTEFMAPAGQKRDLKHQTRIQINEVALEKEGSVIIAGINHPLMPGTCAMVTIYSDTSETFEDAEEVQLSEIKDS